MIALGIFVFDKQIMYYIEVDIIPVLYLRLVSPLVLIDLKSKATANRDYQATPSDIEEWESRYWKIPEGAMVSQASATTTS